MSGFDYDRAQELWAFERAHAPTHRMHVKLVGGFLRARVRGCDVLDVGCGDGRYSQLLEASNRVVSLDVSTAGAVMTRAARRPGSPVLRASAVSLPFAGGRFDAVVALEVFEHIEDDRSAVAECFRVLRPGGRLLFSVPADPGLFCQIDREDGHFRRYSRGEVVDRLFGGYRVSALRGYGFPLMRCYYRLLPLFYSIESPPAASRSLPARALMAALYAVFHLDLVFPARLPAYNYYGVVERE